MIYLLGSILASVTVSILLKLARKNKIDIAQAIAMNYPIALLLSFFFLKPNFTHFNLEKGWEYFALLGFLLPSIFIVMGKAVQQHGIVKADTAQRLSLIVGLIFSFVVWKEDLDWVKIIGITIALVSLFLILFKEKNKRKQGSNPLILLLVWIGFGAIDILFKLISQTTGNDFAITLVFSFAIASILIFGYLLASKTKFKTSSILAGILLGGLNFTNIFTYIKAHQVLNENPSLVFTGMNIGVISLASIIGGLFFKEKISYWNFMGIALAILSIIILFLPS